MVTCQKNPSWQWMPYRRAVGVRTGSRRLGCSCASDRGSSPIRGQTRRPPSAPPGSCPQAIYRAGITFHGQKNRYVYAFIDRPAPIALQTTGCLLGHPRFSPFFSNTYRFFDLAASRSTDRCPAACPSMTHRTRPRAGAMRASGSVRQGAGQGLAEALHGTSPRRY